MMSKGIQSAYDMYTSSHADVAAAIQKTVADTQQAIQDANIANVMASGVTESIRYTFYASKGGIYGYFGIGHYGGDKELESRCGGDIFRSTTAAADGANSDTVKLIMQAPDEATALQIATQSGVANSAVYLP